MASSREKFWIGFDLGGTKMLAGVYTSKLKLLGLARKSTKANEGQRAGIRRLFETIAEALAEAGVRPAQVRGIGMGSPGPLDLNKGMILEAPNLGWTRVPLRDLLEKKFRCRVVIANDVDAGLYGEVQRGAARGAPSACSPARASAAPACTRAASCAAARCPAWKSAIPRSRAPIGCADAVAAAVWRPWPAAWESPPMPRWRCCAAKPRPSPARRVRI